MFIIFACVSVAFGRKTKRHIKLWMESLSVTIQMTASKEYVSVVPFFVMHMKQFKLLSLWMKS